MENNFMKFVHANKWFVVFYLVWVFIHLVLILNGNVYDKNYFWPFGSDDLDYYGWTELFVYVGLPLLIFAIVKLVGNDLRKAIDE